MKLYGNHFEKTSEIDFVPDSSVVVAVRQCSQASTGTDVMYNVPALVLSKDRCGGIEFAVRAVTDKGEECLATVYIGIVGNPIRPNVTVYTSRFPEDALIVYSEDVIKWRKKH